MPFGETIAAEWQQRHRKARQVATPAPSAIGIGAVPYPETRFPTAPWGRVVPRVRDHRKMNEGGLGNTFICSGCSEDDPKKDRRLVGGSPAIAFSADPRA